MIYQSNKIAPKLLLQHVQCDVRSVRGSNCQALSHRPPTTNFLWSQVKDMAKIRLFYSGAVTLILLRLKDIANFVLKIICSLFLLSACLTQI